MGRRLIAVVFLALSVSACGDSAAELAARQEQARIEAERLQQQRESLVRSYSKSAGQQIMSAIGGGQDLIVEHGRWTFDPVAEEFDIPIDVSFNGSIVRANNYRVRGLLTVKANGTGAHFARSEANQNYLDMENLRGVLTALNDLAAAQNQQQD